MTAQVRYDDNGAAAAWFDLVGPGQLAPAEAFGSTEAGESRKTDVITLSLLR